MTVTIKDIAKELGVAQSTVSHVLNGRYKGNYPKTAARAEKIKAYAESRGYRPSAAARAVRVQRTCQIGVLLPNRAGHSHTHPAGFESVLGINNGLQTSGYIVSIIRFDDLTRDVATQTKLFSERCLDGLIVLGHFPKWAHSALSKVVSRIVWMDTDIWRKDGCIRRDEADAVEKMVNHIAAMGWRRMVWVGFPEHSDYFHYSHVIRREQALAVATKANIQVDELHLVPKAGDDELQRLRRSLSPDVVVLAESNYHAQFIAHHAAEYGLTPSRDFMLASCESSWEVNRLWPALTRVTFDRFDMGQQAGEMLRTMIESKKQSVPSQMLRGELIAGKTVRPMSD